MLGVTMTPTYFDAGEKIDEDIRVAQLQADGLVAELGEAQARAAFAEVAGENGSRWRSATTSSPAPSPFTRPADGLDPPLLL